MASQLLINEPPLQVLPSLARIIGLNEAIVLQQVHYWVNPRFNKNVFDGRHWVHNTFAQWQTQFPFWSSKTIKRTIGELEESGLLVSFVTRSFRKTKYYAVNYDLLDRLYSPEVAPAVFASLPGTPTVLAESNLRGEWPANEQHPFLLPAPDGGTFPSGQSGPLGGDILAPSKGSKCPFPWGQPGPLDGANVAPFHYTESTPETTSENSSFSSSCSPSSPSSFEGRRQKEEKEENKIMLKNATANSNSTPVPHPYQQMVQIWNETVQRKIHVGQDVRLSETRQNRLKVFLETILGNKPPSEQMDYWRTYCATIASSKFLTGNNPTGFRVTLDWAINPDNADKVLEGAIYDKPEPTKPHHKAVPWEEFSEELVRLLPSGPHLLPWVKISLNLAKLIGQVKYRDRFLRVSLIELTETTAVFSAENAFLRDYIANHFYSEIRCAVQALYPQVRVIDFQTLPSKGGSQ